MGHRRQKSARSSHPAAGGLYFWLLVVVGTTGMVLGSRQAGISVFQVATPPTLALGMLGYLAAKLRPRPMLGAPWLRWHILGMGGSYIGAVTATTFQIVPRLLPKTTILTVALFVVPSAVGAVLIRRAVTRWLPARSPKAPTPPA